MEKLKSLKDKFDNAQRALLRILFASDESSYSNTVYAQMALDQMGQAFHALLLRALDAPVQATPPQAPEILCVYAIKRDNKGVDSCWEVVFINGNLIPESERLSVDGYTRHMLSEGWKTASLPDLPSTLRLPDGEDVALLYFRRKSSSSETTCILDLKKLIFSSN